MGTNSTKQYFIIGLLLSLAIGVTIHFPMVMNYIFGESEVHHGERSIISFSHLGTELLITFLVALLMFTLNFFILKPVDKQMVEKALNKLSTILSVSNTHQEIARLISSFFEKPKYKTHFLIPLKAKKMIPLLAKDISFIYIDNGVTKARTIMEKTLILENTLDELIQELNPYGFFRANRQFIISRESIKEVELWFHNRLSISLKIPVPEKILISKARVTEFRIWYAGKRSIQMT